MKKIGIITFCNCMNYGAELQAYALQKKLNMLGADAEVIYIEKEKDVLQHSSNAIKNAIVKRYQMYGLFKGSIENFKLIKNKLADRLAQKKNTEKILNKKKIFDSFFEQYIRHTERYYTLAELRNGNIKFDYDVIVAGSDQIWNYLQTKYLDVFFLMFVKDCNIRKVSYAASFSVDKIPDDMYPIYKEYLSNMDGISVREDVGVEIAKSIVDTSVFHVLDPSLLLKANEWTEYVSNSSYIFDKKRYILIYTLSGSRYIYSLAKKIANELKAEVVNIKSGYGRVAGDEGILHLYDVGPREFISLFSNAVYVVTDSFHGTAFSINYNIPFTVLLNPVSALNSRALSILRLTKTMDRLIYDNGSNIYPSNLSVNFNPINQIIEEWRVKSLEFIKNEILL